MAAEVLYIPAKTDDMPRFLARTNSHGAPVAALIMAAGLISLLLVALSPARPTATASHWFQTWSSLGWQRCTRACSGPQRLRSSA